MDHMEDLQFSADGWFDYPAEMNQAGWVNLGGCSKVQPYCMRNCEIYAMRDDEKPFIRSCFNSIASLLNPEVRTLWEHFHHGGAWDKTHEAGYFLHQTRSMPVQERSDEFWLAPFVTYNWLAQDPRVSVHNAPTRSGKVSYELRSQFDQAWVRARIHLLPQTPPKHIVLWIRHPDGRQIKSVTLNGKPVHTFTLQRAIITLKPSADELFIRAEF